MCSAEYQRGQREMGAYAEMVGIVEGALYGYSMILKPGQFCLPGSTPKEKVQAISRALGSEQFRPSPVLMDDVPTEQEALEFFQSFFPCRQQVP